MNQVQILLYYRRLTQLRLGIVCSINCRLTQPAITKGCCYCYMINKKVHFSLDNTIIDPDGRCGIVNISVQGCNLHIASVCGSNVVNPSFFSHSFFLNSGRIRGDFNLLCNSGIDRLSTAGIQQRWQSVDIFKQYRSDFGIDVLFTKHKNMHSPHQFIIHTPRALDLFLVSS